MSGIGPCAKVRVKCTLVHPDGRRWYGENAVRNVQQTCPRGDAPSGVGYEKCRDVCGQVGHAEIVALASAGENAKGCTAYVEGIHYVCQECRTALYAAGVMQIVLAAAPSPNFAARGAEPAGNLPEYVMGLQPVCFAPGIYYAKNDVDQLRAQLSAGMQAAGQSIDTPEFRELVHAVWRSNCSAIATERVNSLTAHINARLSEITAHFLAVQDQCEHYRKQSQDLRAQLSAARQGQNPDLESVLNCYSPDDTVTDYQDKIRTLYAAPQPTAAPTPQAQPAGTADDEVIGMTRRQYLADQNECFRLGEMEGRDSTMQSIAAPAPHEQEARAAVGQMERAEWAAVFNALSDARKALCADGVRHTWLDGAINLAEERSKGNGTYSSPSAQPVHEQEARAAVPNDAAIAAIHVALEDECGDGLQFLRYWNEGEFDVIRRNWANVPDAVFIGADPLHPTTQAGMLPVAQTDGDSDE